MTICHWKYSMARRGCCCCSTIVSQAATLGTYAKVNSCFNRQAVCYSRVAHCKWLKAQDISGTRFLMARCTLKIQKAIKLWSQRCYVTNFCGLRSLAVSSLQSSRHWRYASNAAGHVYTACLTRMSWQCILALACAWADWLWPVAIAHSVGFTYESRVHTIVHS